MDLSKKHRPTPPDQGKPPNPFRILVQTSPGCQSVGGNKKRVGNTAHTILNKLRGYVMVVAQLV